MLAVKNSNAGTHNNSLHLTKNVTGFRDFYLIRACFTLTQVNGRWVFVRCAMSLEEK
jgi:hypothetical protein